MNDPSNWRASKAQKAELLALISKLGWTQEFYESGVQFTIDSMLWHQSIAAISGLEYLLENPRSWFLENKLL